MPMDETDKKLVNGALWFAVIGAVLYFTPWLPFPPWAGYRELQRQQDDAATKLDGTHRNEYVKYFLPLDAAYGCEPVLAKSMERRLEDVIAAHTRQYQSVEEQIKTQQESSRMRFPDWTEPPKSGMQPGAYFDDTYLRKREALREAWQAGKVLCEDEKIGFADYAGKMLNALETREYLRELHIAEKIIRLCIQAKLDQQSCEMSQNRQPEAYMKIIKIKPERSQAKGRTELEKNPNYNPERDSRNPKVRPYISKQYEKFIQEYPVKIELLCDINSFERFLYRVRSPGQFLVIRSLEILSPMLQDSLKDSSEFKEFGTKGREVRAKEVKEEHVLVRIEAAGMDFFDPKDGPLFSNSGDKEKPVRKPRHRIPSQPQ